MATLQDLIKMQMIRDAQAYRKNPTLLPNLQPQPAPEAPTAPPQWLVEAYAKLDDMTARCDALIKRHGVWTRYETGGGDNE